MHKNLPKIYYFINKFDPNHISKLDKKIALIYRNYNKKISFELVSKIKTFCKLNKRIFILSNNYKLALKMDLDGVYIPSFNNDLKHLNYPKKKNFIVLGSAHNIKEIRIKEMQKVNAIFIASLFNKKKNFLGINKFLNLISFTKKRIIALGGINEKNLSKLRLLNINGYAGISFFTAKKTAPQFLEGP